MINVEVVQDNNLWGKKIKKPEIFFKKIISFFPKSFKFKKKKISFTILLSKNNFIKKLNYQFRKKNKPTNVLTFPNYKKKDLKKFLKKKKIYVGDIVISYEYIFKKKYNSFNNKEILIKTFIHGFLHLLGFNHKKNKDFKIMTYKEIKIFNSVNSKIDEF